MSIQTTRQFTWICDNCQKSSVVDDKHKIPSGWTHIKGQQDKLNANQQKTSSELDHQFCCETCVGHGLHNTY